MTKLSNIDIAYEYLKKKKDCASFAELWAVVEQETMQQDVDKRMLMASLYTALVCDNRFSITPENDWGLSDQIKDNDLKKKLGSTITLDEGSESLDLTDEASTVTFEENVDHGSGFYEPTENESYDTFIRDDDTFEKGRSF